MCLHEYYHHDSITVPTTGTPIKDSKSVIVGRVSDGTAFRGFMIDRNLLSWCTKEEMHIHKYFDLLTNCMPKGSGRRERIHCFYLHGDNLFIIKRRNFKENSKGSLLLFNGLFEKIKAGILNLFEFIDSYLQYLIRITS